MALTNNVKVNAWLDEVIPLLKPDAVELITGEKEQLDAADAPRPAPTGEMIKLNRGKAARAAICTAPLPTTWRVWKAAPSSAPSKEEDAGPTNNWMDPKEMYAKLNKLYDGAMKGRTMYVIPYSMGVVGSPFAKYGIELTDSIYVVLNMAIMTRVGQHVLDALGDSDDFVKGLHCQGGH